MMDLEIVSRYTGYGISWARKDIACKRALDNQGAWELFKIIMEIKEDKYDYKEMRAGFDSGYTYIIMEEMVKKNIELCAFMYKMNNYI